VTGSGSGLYQWSRARIPMVLNTVNELRESARAGISRVSMVECGCPCADHAPARADRNRGPHRTRSISTCFSVLWTTASPAPQRPPCWRAPFPALPNSAWHCRRSASQSCHSALQRPSFSPSASELLGNAALYAMRRRQVASEVIRYLPNVDRIVALLIG